MYGVPELLVVIDVEPTLVVSAMDVTVAEVAIVEVNEVEETEVDVFDVDGVVDTTLGVDNE
jgi:hypothetical protein